MHAARATGGAGTPSDARRSGAVATNETGGGVAKSALRTKRDRSPSSSGVGPLKVARREAVDRPAAAAAAAPAPAAAPAAAPGPVAGPAAVAGAVAGAVTAADSGSDRARGSGSVPASADASAAVAPAGIAADAGFAAACGIATGIAADAAADAAAAAAAAATAGWSGGGADPGTGNFHFTDEHLAPLPVLLPRELVIATTEHCFRNVGLMLTDHPITAGATSALFTGDEDAQRIVARWMAGARNTPAGCLRATLRHLGFNGQADPPAGVVRLIQRHAHAYVQRCGSALLEQQFESAFATLRGSLSNTAISQWHAAGGELLVECQMVTPLVREPFLQAFGTLYW